jgi:2-polyprenyl-6-methoxyphenol hydroxylase-like FAD-dependent oxidoreductase
VAIMAGDTPAWRSALPRETDVLIVGGGPVGLSAALELGRRGVRCLIVEPRTTVSGLRPRAKTTNIRTMEHFRRWGLADRIREVAPLKVDWSQDIVFCTTLLGPEVLRFSDCLGVSPQRIERFAESGQQIAQPLVEVVLREAVGDLASCQLCLGWSLHALQQHADGVRATLTDERGEQQEVAASYLLGCDGARSVVRAAIGVRYAGTSDQRPNFGVVFRAPGLAERQPHGPALQYWVLDPACPGLLGRMDLGDRWWLIANGVPAEVGQADPLALIRGLVGDAIDAEILGTDPWTARMLLADRYRAGRVFLVGDAAHLNPPWGGHGFNTGIGDAVNIGWKLAATLGGWGGDALLDSYEAERRPIAEQTIAEATANMRVLAPELGDRELTVAGPAGERARRAAALAIRAAKDRAFHSLGLVLGYAYDMSPVIVGDGTPAPPAGQGYTPTARPGARLPHRWLPDGRSLYDGLGDGLTLLRLRDDGDTGPFVTSAAARGVPLRVLDLRDQVPAGDYGAALLLVRPDQHVAWRGAAVDRAGAGAIIERACGVSRASGTEAAPAGFRSASRGRVG